MTGPVSLATARLASRHPAPWRARASSREVPRRRDCDPQRPSGHEQANGMGDRLQWGHSREAPSGRKQSPA